jgi:hypothetical protein
MSLSIFFLTNAILKRKTPKNPLIRTGKSNQAHFPE